MFSTLIIAFAFFSGLNALLVPPSDQDKITTRQNVSTQILEILDHYKQKDPLGIPGVPIPDPLPVPPFTHKLSIGVMNFKDVKIYGLKKFKIDYMKANIADMSVDVSLNIKVLDVFGNYTLSSFWTKAMGNFTVQMNDVNVKALASLEVKRTGQLEAQEVNMDITFKKITMDFNNLGFFASMFQGVINSLGDSLFNSIKPFILSEVNTNIRNDVNKELRNMSQRFPNSISPLDQLFITFRQEIRKRHYDPYLIPEYNNSIGIFDIYMRDTVLYGLSSVHRSGNVTVELKNNTVYAYFEGGSKKVRGVGEWELALVAGIISKKGKIDFSVNYFTVKVNISQTANTDFPPKIEDIQLELGNIELRFDGVGTADYVVELLINVMPNLLRYQIMNALEGPVKTRIQEALNNINIKSLIVENADKIDNPELLQM